MSAIAVVVSETPPAIVTTALFSCALLIDKKWKYLPRRNLWPLLGQAGAISYSLYLVHVPIGVYFGGKLLSIWTDANLSEVLIKDVVLLVLTVLAAWAMYLLVERPSLALGRAWARSTMPDHKTRAPVSS